MFQKLWLSKASSHLIAQRTGTGSQVFRLQTFAGKLKLGQEQWKKLILRTSGENRQAYPQTKLESPFDGNKTMGIFQQRRLQSDVAKCCLSCPGLLRWLSPAPTTSLLCTMTTQLDHLSTTHHCTYLGFLTQVCYQTKSNCGHFIEDLSRKWGCIYQRLGHGRQETADPPQKGSVWEQGNLRQSCA